MERLGGQIGKVKEDLEHNISEEANHRDNLGTNIGEQLEIVTRRFEASGSGKYVSKSEPDKEDSNRWKPQHIVMAGWPSKLARQHRQVQGNPIRHHAALQAEESFDIVATKLDYGGAESRTGSRNEKHDGGKRSGEEGTEQHNFRGGRRGHHRLVQERRGHEVRRQRTRLDEDQVVVHGRVRAELEVGRGQDDPR